MTISFRVITVKELPDIAGSEYFAGSEEVPVTSHRALSLAANPCASDEDPAILLAIDEKNRLLGYWGFLSDHLDGNHTNKIMWNSGWRVMPGASHAAMPLLYKALQTCGNKILFSDLTLHTKQILEATGKVTVHTRKGIRWYFRSCSYELVSRRNFATKLLSPFFFFLDFDINLLFVPFLRKTRMPDGFKCIEVPSFNEDDQNFINSIDITSLSGRGIKELNWIKENPWIIPLEKDDPKNRSRYYFSSSEKHFETRFFRIQKEGQTIALAFMNNRNGHVTLPYFICKPGQEKAVAIAIASVTGTLKAKTFTTFNPLFLKSETDLSCISKKSISRFFAYGNKTGITFSEDILIQDGDGDCAFT